MYHTPRVVVYVCEEGKCGEPHMAAGSEIGFLGKLLIKIRFPELCTRGSCQLLVWRLGKCFSYTASFIFNTF